MTLPTSSAHENCGNEMSFWFVWVLRHDGVISSDYNEQKAHRQFIHLHKINDTTVLILHDTETRSLVWIHSESHWLKNKCTVWQTHFGFCNSLTSVFGLRVSDISAASPSSFCPADAHFLIAHPRAMSQSAESQIQQITIYQTVSFLSTTYI